MEQQYYLDSMPAPEAEAPSEVAILCVRDAMNPLEKLDEVIRVIMLNEQFDIGRDDISGVRGKHMTISKHHLRFHCIMYGDDPTGPHVNPLVYVRVLSFNPVKLTHLDVNHRKHDVFLTKDSGNVLLNQDDVLELTPTISILFEQFIDEKDIDKPLDPICQAETAEFVAQYKVTDRLLGAGGNASVFLALHRPTQRQVACKIVSLPIASHSPTTGFRNDADQSDEKLSRRRGRLEREYSVLKDLDHPNIIRLEKVFCGPCNIYILQELITGGDLLSYMHLKGVSPEPQAAAIMLQVVKAVDYLHRHGIAHRDIKPENILMTSWADGARVVLTDFGGARLISGSLEQSKKVAISRMQTFVGTIGYAAPEVLKHNRREADGDHGGYSEAVDVWSVGCITASLLVNELLFPLDETREANARGEEFFSQNNQQRWSLDIMDKTDDWRAVSRKAKSFIRGCLVLDEAERYTAVQALQHEWFTNKYYAADLEAAYTRAIADWQPRGHCGNIVEVITLPDAVIKAARTRQDEVTAPETTSTYFPTTPKQKAFQMPPLNTATTMMDLNVQGKSKQKQPQSIAVPSLDCSAYETLPDSLQDLPPASLPDLPPLNTQFEPRITQRTQPWCIRSG